MYVIIHVLYFTIVVGGLFVDIVLEKWTTTVPGPSVTLDHSVLEESL